MTDAERKVMLLTAQLAIQVAGGYTAPGIISELETAIVYLEQEIDEKNSELDS